MLVSNRHIHDVLHLYEITYEGHQTKADVDDDC